MNRVNIDLENCYGIKKLKAQLDFTNDTVNAIYAPNGTMKTSLAQTFRDIADGVVSVDRIFPLRPSSRKITDEHSHLLTKESVFAVRPYDEEFGHTEKTSTLLVDTKLRKEYEQLDIGIEAAKSLLLKALRDQSHSKKDLAKEVSSAFTSSDGEFETALIRIKKELHDQKDTPFANVAYDTIFDEKVLEALSKGDLKTAIAGYVHRSNELLSASTYFKKGTFDYYNAGQIAKSLADNGFFAAKHTVNLNASERLEIRTQKELEDVITREKEAILKDKALRKQFDDVDTLLKKNVTLRDFRSYLLDNEALLPPLANMKKFKEDIWKSYLKVKFDLYADLMEKIESAQARKKEIEGEAGKQRTQWEEVIQIFNDRFFVPFKLAAKNRTAVMLGDAPMIDLGFTYHDGPDNVPMEKAALLKVLSTGERKALYILNIIFSVEVKKKAGQETLMVIDDLADSFDYQNKYAIIQYLKDISQGGLFKQIIMTHNFDFFRTLNSRFVPYPNCWMASKSDTGLALEQASGIKNVFTNDWKPHFFSDPKKRIASIPFIRNLVEYIKGEDDPTFKKLTSLLHWKADSVAITETELDAIFKEVFGASTGSAADLTKLVVDSIQEQAKLCLVAATGINFENKIVLAIAIRLCAEKFMVGRIKDPVFAASIQFQQTQALVTKFKSLFPGDTKTIETLDRVLLMTPENIHLNSFMYEPIVDMSDQHLRRLYKAVSAL